MNLFGKSVKKFHRLGERKLYFVLSVFIFAFRLALAEAKNGAFEVAVLVEGRDLDLDSRETSLRGQRETSELLVATLSSGY